MNWKPLQADSVRVIPMLTAIGVVLVYTGRFVISIGSKVLSFSYTDARRKYLALLGI
jgi:hypothetical protein